MFEFLQNPFTERSRSERELVKYMKENLDFVKLLDSISPLVALDDDHCIQFVNESFKKEFNIKNKLKTGENLFQILKLKTIDTKEFKDNILLSKSKKVQNCEFKIKSKIYGYSIFRFGNSIGIILKDITENKKLQKKVANLHSQLLKLQEKERENLARELHDSVGQTILAAKLNFNSYEKDPVKFRDRFNVGLSLIDRTSQELREIYTALHPSVLKELGLEAAIRSLVKNLLEPSNCKTTLSIKIKNKLSYSLEVNLFRITQEIITNIVKHSKASNVDLKLTQSKNRINLHIQDNGKGFSEKDVKLKSKGFGLVNIRRRVEDMNGKIKIESTLGLGANFDIYIPIT